MCRDGETMQPFICITLMALYMHEEWKIEIYLKTFVRVCMCARARARVCVCVCVHACEI